MSVYYSPEEHGLETIGEIDWSDGDYQFELTVVWRRDDGTFLTGDDSGCSCPSPFEDVHDPTDLTEVATLAEFQSALLARSAENYNGTRDVEVAELIERMHKAGAR